MSTDTPEPVPAAEPAAPALNPSVPPAVGSTASGPTLPSQPIPKADELPAQIGVAPPAEIVRMPMRRLSAIEIHNYRAYRGTFRVEMPQGENLLVYGENGGGKSSLFHTLRVFLEAPDWHVTDSEAKKSRPVAVTDHRHRFTTDAPSVKLEFGPVGYEWSEAVNHTGHERMRLVNQGKGFLDYKALLEVHYVPSDDGRDLDLFELLIRRLLPYYTFPFGGKNWEFQVFWRRLNNNVRLRWRKDRREKDFLAELAAFNEALERAVHDLGKRASELLEKFGDEFRTEFHFEKAEFKSGPKRVMQPRILALPAFRKQQIRDYSRFFNEARLSALAICLFFGALKESPAVSLRILALDDILIGLDMANRVTVLQLIREHFGDWQILVLTYSKAWFELLKERVQEPGWAAKWKAVTLWENWRDEDNSPHIVAEGSGDMVQMAERHLRNKDYKAAAVYARSALEALCHHTCARAALPLLHVDEPKKRKLEDYLTVLEHRLGELSDDARRHTAQNIIARLRQARAFVLNRKSHFDVEEEDVLTAEVGAAIQTVKDFAAFLETQTWGKANFKERNAPAVERMPIELAEARKLAAFHQPDDAAKSLAAAHHLAWEAYGVREKVALPIGEPLAAKSIWDAALAQGKLDAALDARLRTARPYLFGGVKAKDFDAIKFEDAAKLLEELSAQP